MSGKDHLRVGDPDVEVLSYVFNAVYEKMKESGEWTHYRFATDKSKYSEILL